ncbi:MAG: DUF3298 and DUF4163 domain-containing protein [Lachnospiraceae bacterium]|nr:DUF3298 and DUF4163 domain-containing protein [Lachnospiraceae bacterium]
MDDQRKQELQTSGKEIYNSIIIPSELDELVKKTIASRDKEFIDKQHKETLSPISEMMKYIGAAAALIVVSIIIGLNSSESFAKEMGEVPVLGAVAKVFTVRNYTLKKDELTINERVPNVEVTTAEQIPEKETPVPSVSDNEQEQIIMETENDIVPDTVSDNSTVSGNENKDDTHVTISGNDIISVSGDEKRVIDSLDTPVLPVTVSSNDVYTQAMTVNDFTLDINQKINNYVQKYISNETERFEEYKTAFFETGGTEEEWADRKFDITVDYELKYQRGAVVSFVITATENWCAAYGERTFYNLDLLNGKNVILSDLLGKNYIEVANVQIIRQMKERVKENPDYVYWGITDEGAVQGFDGFTTVSADTDFYINAAGNPVIVFDKYEVGPGFMGEQEFEIIVEYDSTPD